MKLGPSFAVLYLGNVLQLEQLPFLIDHKRLVLLNDGYYHKIPTSTLSSSGDTCFHPVTVTYWTQAERLHCPKEPVGGWPPNRINTTQRLIWLRNEMGRVTSVRGPILNAFIITSDDEHQGEYSAERDKRLQYISGFSGLFGYAVVTKSAAALWTTEKYYALADQQLDCNWELIKLGEPGAPTITEWLKKVLKRALYRVGADPKMISSTMWEEWNRELAADKLALTEVPNNLIDLIWTIGRPAYSLHPAFVLPPDYAGETWQNKVISLRQNLSRFGCDAMIVTGLEEIAWLLNIRGRDLEYNPFVKAYLIVERDWLRLYIPKEKITEGVRRQLKIDSYGPLSVRLFPYDMVFNDIRTLSQAWTKVLVPSACVYTAGASQAVVSAVPPEKRFLRQSPIILTKAKKNPVEARGMRSANLRDSAAFIDFIAQMEEEMKNEGNWTETKVIRTLEKYRLEQNLTQGMAFPTVAAFGSHGALFYYEPSNKTNRRIDDSSTLIIESGGHYYDGTSDVIRTFHFGTPTRDMIEAYTTILSAMIQLMMATFPHSTKTTDLDTIVRSKLWKAGINYRMDVGHGIGFFSNVRESPVMINSDSRLHRQTLKEGYFLTCEPTYVKPYRYGIKLGNVLEVVSKSPNPDGKPGSYLGLEEVTLVPFEQKLIDTSMLSKEELDWLNSYHLRVMQEAGAELKRQSRMTGFYWLMERTKEMSQPCNAGHVILPAATFVALCIFLPLLGLLSA